MQTWEEWGVLGGEGCRGKGCDDECLTASSTRKSKREFSTNLSWLFMQYKNVCQEEHETASCTRKSKRAFIFDANLGSTKNVLQDKHETRDRR